MIVAFGHDFEDLAALPGKAIAARLKRLLKTRSNFAGDLGFDIGSITTRRILSIRRSCEEG